MRVAAAGEQLEPLMSVDECRSPARGISVLPEMVILGTGIQEEQTGEHGIREAPMQRHRLDQHVTSPVGEALLEVAGPNVTEVDRLDRNAAEQAGFFRCPVYIDLLRTHAPSHRSEDSRVGNECDCTCRSRWSPAYIQKKIIE